MLDVVNSEAQIVSERQYNQTLDLCPLEHVLIGSTTSPKDKNINLDVLMESKELARDENLLLKPVGLTNGERIVEDVVKGRAEKQRLSGWIACFQPTAEISFDYSFDYIISQPDSSDMIPNRFEFKFRKNDNEDSVLTQEDINAFRKVELDKDIKGLFALARDENKAMFTITYLPLQQKPETTSQQ